MDSLKLTKLHRLLLYCSCFFPHRHNADPLEGIHALGFQNASGPELFNEVASLMADDVLDLSSASARRLYNAFEKAYHGTSKAKHLSKLHPLAPLQLLHEIADDDEMVVSKVAIDLETGQCPRTGARLTLLKLDQDQRKQLRDGLRILAGEQYGKFHANSKAQHVDPRQELDSFENFLE